VKNAVAILGLDVIHKEGKPDRYSSVFWDNLTTWRKDNRGTYNLRIFDLRDYLKAASPVSAMLNELLEQCRLIDCLLIASHSDPEGLYLLSKTRKELKQKERYILADDPVWDHIALADDAKIYLMGCQAGGMHGQKFARSIAQDIANHTDRSTYAFVYKSSQQKRADGGYEQRPEKGDYVLFTKDD
jgi:hypothetical protein